MRIGEGKFSGVMLRGSGVSMLGFAKSTPYEVYDRLDLNVPVGTRRDNYDRCCIRIGEDKVFESLRDVLIK